jgi:membrane protein YqaA with SNARE-associated domain
MIENLNFALIDLYSYIEYFEYIGIFAVSLLAGIVTVIPIPVAPLLALAALDEQMNPHLLVLSAAAGSVAAKALIFWCSYYGRNILSIKTRTRMLPLHKFINKFGWIAVILTSATPIPDAPVNIHLGLAKYDFWKFIIAAFIGKLIAYELVVFAVIYLGRSFLNDSISKINDAQLLTVGLAITISYAVILYLTFILDWTRVLGKRWSDPEKDV